MRGLRQVLVATSLAAGVALTAGAVHAAKFKVLHSFCRPGHRVCGDGSNPGGPLVMDAAGNFYGTASTGGLDAGTVFELERKQDGSFNFKTLYRFCTQGTCGWNPSGALVIDTAGNLYGTAANLVFELSPGGKKGQWIEKVLHRFCSNGCGDGNDAVGGLTYAGASSGAPYDGVSPLFGATGDGGANGGGAVFELSNSHGEWAETVLYSFCSQGGDSCTDGKLPLGRPVADGAGNLFGATFEGGNPFQGVGAGVVYELSPNGKLWTQTTLYRFCALAECGDGALPQGDLAIDAMGMLYGTTSVGGKKCKPGLWGCGLAYKLVPNGAQSQQTVLYTFCEKRDCRDGSAPTAGLSIDSVGNIFGTTFFGGGNDIDSEGKGGGTAFKLTGALHQVLHSFCSADNCADGAYPSAQLTLDPSENVYGTTSAGGAFGGSEDGGVVFKLKH